MGLSGSFVGGRRGVAADHLPARPSGEAHQVGLLASGGEEVVAEGGTQHVGVYLGNAGLATSSLHHLADPASGKRPFATKPQLGTSGLRVTVSSPQVAVHRLQGLGTHRHRSMLPTFAAHMDHLETSEIEFGEGKPCGLGESGPGVEVEADESGVATVIEDGARGGGEQLSQILD